MTWNYGADPLTSDTDKVRVLIGDTDITDPQLSDEVIAWLNSIDASPFAAAVSAAGMLEAKYARLVNRTIGTLSIESSQKRDAYKELRRELADRASSAEENLPTPIATGIRWSDKWAAEQDYDRVTTLSRIGWTDHPGTMQQMPASLRFWWYPSW